MGRPKPVRLVVHSAARNMMPTQTFTPAQAAYVVERLIADRKLKATEIEQYMRELQGEIETLELRIAALRADHSGSRAEPVTLPARSAGGKTPPKKRDGRAGHVRGIAGTFAVLLRSLPAKLQDEYVRMREERGLKNALEALRKIQPEPGLPENASGAKKRGRPAGSGTGKRRSAKKSAKKRA